MKRICNQIEPKYQKANKIIIKWVCIFLSILGILIIPIMLLCMIYLADIIVPWNITRLNDGINVWFSFWGTYIGALLTASLTIYTANLSKKFDRHSEKNARVQVAMEFHQFQIKEVQLYDLARGFPLNVIEKFSNTLDGRYIFQIIFDNLFPAYFEVQILKFLYKDRKGKDYEITLDKKQYSITNNKEFEISCLILREAEIIEDINYFYYINYFHPEIMMIEERSRFIGFEFQCQNQMDKELEINDKERMRFKLQIKVENMTKYDGNFAILKVMERNLKYLGKSEEKND